MRREIKKINEKIEDLSKYLREYKISSYENLTEILKIIREIRGIASGTIKEIGQAVIEQSEISSEKFNFLCETLLILIPNEFKFSFVQRGLVLVDKSVEERKKHRFT